jgi:TrmH family RNA methyltransferase
VSLDVESPANRRIIGTARLKNRRHRDAEGRFLIEGMREVARALDASVGIGEVFFAPGIASAPATALVDRAAGAGIPVTTVSAAAFAKLSVRQGPDGIVAVAPTWSIHPEELDADVVLVAEGIEKPGNLGAMLRSADAVGAAVLIADPMVDPFNPNAVRASQGSLFTVPFAIAGREDAVAWCRSRGPVVVATPEAVRTYWEVPLTGPVSIVIGAEHEGVSDAWDDVGTEVRIPMSGAADSLNASVAAALILFEAARQRLSTG